MILTDPGTFKLHMLPAYSRIPILLVIIVNFLTFNGTRLINRKKHHYDFSTAADDHIPFCPPAVFIYVTAFAQWILGYILIASSGKTICYTFTTADLIAKAICAACFIFIPTKIDRPSFRVKGPSTALAKFIFLVDTPDNLFPSIHCLESWLVWRATLAMPFVPSWFQWAMFILTVSVCASTVMLKQHVFVDIIGGIAAAEIGIEIAKIFF